MLAPPLIFAGLAVMFWMGMSRENPNALPSALTGQSAPTVVLTRLNDMPLFGDDDLRAGQVTLVNYWASWCAPCRVEHPNLEVLKQQGITIYGVNYKDDPDKAMRFLGDLGNPYAAMGADTEGRMALNWGVYGVPETYVIDGQGKIVLRFAGPITQRVLESTILPAIKEAQSN
jgi:cytochrome c biogenesis protein CcmG/thiol:disulfide interchange protein DsbE